MSFSERDALTSVSGVVRPTVAVDTWIRANLAEIARLSRERGRLVERDEAIGHLLPHEARCLLCEEPPLEPGETSIDLMRKLVEQGSAIGPASRVACSAWLDKHLRQRHGLRGIEGGYEVDSGEEQWL